MKADVCVLGLGYIGLPTALLMASSGFRVHGMDISQQRIEELTKDEIVHTEPGVAPLVEAVLTEGLLSFGSDLVEAETYVISVNTPLTSDKSADLRAVIRAGESLLPWLRKDVLIVLESTVPVGTTEELLVPILNRGALQAGKDFDVAFCPERAMPGNLLDELRCNPRIIGGLTARSVNHAVELYSHFTTGEIHRTDLKTAEMVKLMENTYRDVNIALANEMARLAEAQGVSIWEARRLANLHPRVSIHTPGPGVGGHCLPVDPYFLRGADLDDGALMLTARVVNREMPGYVAARAIELLPAAAHKVAVLGATYKSGTDDTRNSPAIALIERLREQGLDVAVSDPVTKVFCVPLQGFEEAVDGADLLIFVVDHEQYRRLDPRKVAEMTPARMVMDTRNFLDHRRWQEAGFSVYVLGAGWCE